MTGYREPQVEYAFWVETRVAGRTTAVRKVASISRHSAGIQAEEIGLTLAEGRHIVREIQRSVVTTQFDILDAATKPCIHCQKPQRVKDVRCRRIATVFGNVSAECRRYVRCTCRGGRPNAIWPIAAIGLGRSTPELDYLVSSWGSRMPYRRAASLLSEVLPISVGRIGHDFVRRRTLAVGEWLDVRATEPAEYDGVRAAPPPLRLDGRPLCVAIDGTYVRSDLSSGMNRHCVVAGRVQPGAKLGTRFAWVTQSRRDATAFLRSALEDNGWTPGVPVTALADGADGLGAIVNGAAGEKGRTVLDWFHISMRLRPIEQMGPGIAKLLSQSDPIAARLVRDRLPGIRYQMWNGGWRTAGRRMHDIYLATKPSLEQQNGPRDDRVRRFQRLLFELNEYLRNNSHALTHYRQAYQKGLYISSAVAESGMNHLINQRMGKRQPMRWTAEGAHLLLQVRCADVDNCLGELFRERYPAWRGHLQTVPPTTM